MATFYQELQARGIVKQVTSPELERVLDAGKVTLYVGIDPTSDTLHVGHLIGLLALRRFQLAGHRPIVVVGGATGMIGDPSGKSQERSLLDDGRLRHNLAGLRKGIGKFLDFGGPNAALLANNADWFAGVSFIDFLRDVGKHFTVNHMMAKESVRARLEDRSQGISYTEFSYMLLQAYDFKVLHDRERCTLQIGGSDQWGNITAGIELIRRMKEGDAPEVFGLTHPLVSKADGTKFGKSEEGTVWLDAAKTSPYRFYQFFIQTTDADVMTYLRFFTFLPLERLDEIERSHAASPEKRVAQTTLARELTRLVHGEAEFKRAEATSQALFGPGIRLLDEATLLEVLSGAPSSQRPRAQLEAGAPLVDLLAETGLCPSKGQARKDVSAGGIYLNNERVTNAALLVRAPDLIASRHLVLRKGKKNYFLVTFS